MADSKSAHTLVGIVSKGFVGSCGQDEYAIFTNVQSLMPWIKSSIIENGGMASCNFNFSAPPALGPIDFNVVLINF